MRRELTACLLALIATFATVPALAQTARRSSSHLADAPEVRKRLGLAPDYENVAGVEGLKIAVLDFGFDGMGGNRPYLPSSAEVVEHYDPEFVRRNGLGDPAFRKGFEPGNRHGRDMAQVVWAVTGGNPSGPKFYLLNANGPTMLRRAVRYAIAKRVDVILLSGSFEGGGNGDGRGPINKVVDEALAAGIIWVNAAGNYGRRVFNGPIRVLPDGYLRLRDGSDVASLRFRNRVDENAVTVTLSWNDYRDEEDAGTDRDLDLYVEDWTGRRVGSGQKVQVAGDRTPGPEETRNPRERVVLVDLPASPAVPSDPDYAYRIRVRAKAGRFTTGDRLRVLLTTGRDVYVAPGGNVPEEAVEFLDASGGGELFPPADHPGVVTVGDGGPASSIGPTADGRGKPDLIIEDSRAFFTDGQVTAGSSNAAAYFAGVALVLKAVEPSLSGQDLLHLARQGVPAARDGRAARPASSAGASSLRPPPPGPVFVPRVWQTPGRVRLAQAVRDGRAPSTARVRGVYPARPAGATR